MSIATIQASMIDRLPTDNTLLQFSNQPPLLLQNMPQQGKSVLFIDSSVASAEQLAAGAVDGTSTYLLDASRDEMVQITDVLSGLTNVASVQIVSHGKAGGLQLGSSWLDLQTLPSYVDQLKSWGQALTAGADILLYGCNVAEGAVGQTFVNLLAETTGADVAASNDLTGSESLGGNWNLEVQTGRIETSIAVGSTALGQYTDILGASRVKDITPGGGSTKLSSLTNVNGTLFFLTDDGLWKSNGTDATTVKIKALNLPPDIGTRDQRDLQNNFVRPLSLTSINNKVYFTASESSSSNFELWESDGTLLGTKVVKEINPTGSSDVFNTTNINGTLYFFANNGSGAQLWKSDGTSNNTIAVTNLSYPNARYSNLTYINGEIYFKGVTATTSIVLKSTLNGSVTQIFSSPIVSEMVNLDGTLYFSALAPRSNGNFTSGVHLFKTDGTTNGTIGLSDLSGEAYVANLTNVGGTLYFTANGSSGVELWISNGVPFSAPVGTLGRTRVINDIYPGPNNSSPSPEGSELVNVNGVLYHNANNGSNGAELWDSTSLVKDINPGINGSKPSWLTNINGTLYFRANDGQSGFELWKSDRNGTTRVADINPGSGSSSEDPSLRSLGVSPSLSIVDINGTLYFGANDGTSGFELWKFESVPSKPQPDLLLRNSTTKEVAIWGLDGSQIAAGGFAQLANGTLVQLDSNWRIVSGKSDFNGDGIRDIVWFNDSTTETAIWYMQYGSTGVANIISSSSSFVYTPGSSVAYKPGGQWKLAAVTDLLGDSRPEFLWEDRSTGVAAIWQLNIAADGKVEIAPTSAFITSNGTQVSNGGTPNNWRINGVGNFDGNVNTREILWFNEITTETKIWQLNGAIRIGDGYLNDSNGVSIKPGLGWKPVAISNVDGAGTDEIILQNGTSVAVWQLNNVVGSNFTLTSKSIVLSQSLAVGEQIQGVADIDVNGSMDLLVRRKSGGTDTTRMYALNTIDFQISNPTPPRYITLSGQTAPFVTGDSNWDIADVADLGGPLK
jgi:ELWxxDGT repeat protein